MRHDQGHGARGKPRGPEVADILRDHAYALPLTRLLVRVVSAIVSCRTVRLGGHREVCPECGFKRPAYNSCRDRHCPKCQILMQELWAETQEERLLPTHYFHVTFTVAAELRRLFRRAPEVCLALLFRAASETLRELALTNLRAQIGFTAVLHTWTQRLLFHPHLHVIVPGGGLARDGSPWIACKKNFFLPVDPLRTVFKGKLLDKLRSALSDGRIPIDRTEALALIARAAEKTWVVEVKPPLAGPTHVVRYLSRYAHRIAIANSRIVSYDGRTVVFRYKNRKTGATETEKVSAKEFCRRFLRHVLPDRFVRIRHYGLLASRKAKDLAPRDPWCAGRRTAHERERNLGSGRQAHLREGPAALPGLRTRPHGHPRGHSATETLSVERLTQLVDRHDDRAPVVTHDGLLARVIVRPFASTASAKPRRPDPRRPAHAHTQPVSSLKRTRSARIENA